jgi:hypothetical protein
VAEADRAFLAAEAEAFAAQLPRGELRDALAAVVSASDAGEVPDELEERVGSLAALSIETGRARSVHGSAGVRALTALWKDSPQGRRAAEEARELEQALVALRGRSLEAVRVIPTGPGAHAITIAAGGVEVRLSVEVGTVGLRGVNVGSGGMGE